MSGMSASTMQRYLYDLRALDVVHASGHGPQARYQMSECGLRFLAAAQQIMLGRIAEWESLPDGQGTGYLQRGVRMLRRNGRHTAGIYLLLRLLYETAQHERHHRVLWWETGAYSERSYRAHSTWRNLRPDAVFAYQAGAQQLVAWVEWDEGSMTARDLAAKLYAYQRFLHAREWGSYDTNVVPLLLFIVPEKAQEIRVIKIARAILAAEGIIVRSTTATRLRREGPLGAIWYPVVPREPQATSRHPLFPAEKP